MLNGPLLRRLVHLLTPVFLVYYYLPDPVWEGGPGRAVGLAMFLVAILIFELLRLMLPINIPGMRDYERERISAAAWAAMGLTLIFLTLPIEYAAPAVLGMAWVDPLIGDLRRRESKWYPRLPLLVHFLIGLVSMGLLISWGWEVLIAAIIAAVSAVAVEKVRWSFMDDDFTMMVVPAYLIAAWFALIGLLL